MYSLKTTAALSTTKKGLWSAINEEPEKMESRSLGSGPIRGETTQTTNWDGATEYLSFLFSCPIGSCLLQAASEPRDLVISFIGSNPATRTPLGEPGPGRPELVWLC